MLDKKLIKQRFAKNLKTYREHAIIQNKMAETLTNMIDILPVSVLELGCGCGILTEKLLSKFNIKTYTAVDIVEECETYIKEISQNIKFIPADIEKYNFEEKYDLIISNATFQWIENLPVFIEKLKPHLTPAGKIIFSTFGKDNLKEIKKITGIGLNYNMVDSLKNYEIKEEIFPLEFNTPKDVLKHLKFTGVNSISAKHWTKSDLKKFEETYKNLYQNKIILTYTPIYIIIQSKQAG